MLVSVGTYQHFGSADYEPASLFPESNTHEVWVGSGVERDYPEVVHEPPGKKSCNTISKGENSAEGGQTRNNQEYSPSVSFCFEIRCCTAAQEGLNSRSS